MSDVFSEVDEQVRSDRLRTAVTKGWPVALAVGLIALGAWLAIWGWRTYQHNRSTRASDAYAQGLDLLSRGDAKGAEARFADVARSAPGAYKALALMQQAGLRVKDHKDVEAAGLLDEAAKAAPTPVLGDAAKLKSAMILMDRRPLAEIEARLNPLAISGRPYRWIARELIGMARIQAGQIKAARGDFAVISLAQDVSETSRARARAAMALIDDGTAATLPALVKASLDATPMPQPPPSLGAMSGAASGAAQAEPQPTTPPVSAAAVPQAAPAGTAQ